MMRILIIIICLSFSVTTLNANNLNQLEGEGVVDSSLPYEARGDAQAPDDSNTFSRSGDVQDPWYFMKKLWYGLYMYQYIDQKMEEENIVGLSISVVHHNDTLFMHGFGHADEENGIPATPFTLYRVGSISKLFTGIAIMQLVEQGLIDLDAPLDTYLPDFSVKSRFSDTTPITVRMLMTHQSGLPEEKWRNNASYSFPHEDHRQFVDYLKDEYVAYPPQYISSYSNLAVSLLGDVIEKVTGTRFHAYIEQNLLKPMRMHASNIQQKDFFLHPLMSKGYYASGEEFDFYYGSHIPAGGLQSSSFEMSRFMKMILNGGESYGREILQQSTLSRMFEQQNKDIIMDLPEDKGMRWGLSWMLCHSSHLFKYAGKYVGHGGYTPPFRSELHILPEHGLGVTVTANTASLSSDIADEALVKALEIFKGIKQPDADPVPEETALTADMVDQMVGVYASGNSGLFTIQEDEGGLRLSVNGGPGVALVPHVDNWFSLEENGHRFEGLRLSVRLMNDEKVLLQESRTTRGGVSKEPLGVAYDISKEIPQTWKNRMGEYEIINPDDSLLDPPPCLLGHQGNVMYLQVNNVLAPLLPISENEILLSGMGRGSNETLQIKTKEGEEYLSYSGFMFKKKIGPQKRQMFQGPESFADVFKQMKTNRMNLR